MVICLDYRSTPPLTRQSAQVYGEEAWPLIGYAYRLHPPMAWLSSLSQLIVNEKFMF